MIEYKKIDEKWQKRWDEKGVFVAKNKGKKYYVLEMFPYPSGFAGHVGHARNFVLGDSFARFKRMNGFDVLYPMGWDAFGQPTENAAIKLGIHPTKSMANNIKRFKEQLRQLSLSYDWSREVNTSDKDYYRWTQWIFLKLFEKKLAYKKFALGNWCPGCKTVLSNEDSKDGKCWRCNSEVIQKEIDQWFFKITDYADRLLEDLNKIEWSDRLKSLQVNWIGKSHGTNLIFPIKGMNKEITTFTTRPDTYFGITFVAMAPEHPLVPELIKDSKNKKEIDKFLEDAKKLTELERTSLLKEKKGIFTGKYMINPITKEEIPIYLANYVVGSYGTGVVIGVPTHDQRDFEFAKQYGISMKKVIELNQNRIVVIKDSLKPEFYKNIKDFAKIDENDGLCYIYTDKIDNVFNAAKGNFVGGPWYIHSEGTTKKIMFHSEKEDKIFNWSKDLKITKEYGISIKIKKEQLDFDQMYEAYTSDGIMVNSDKFNGMKNTDAMKAITDHLIKLKWAQKVTNYKLRDWCVSRQKYWGAPIPIIYCKKCGTVPVPEKDLPVELPLDVEFGKKGAAPLATNSKFVNVKCPKCKGPAKRETDTMTTFVDSAWYYLRYCSPHYDKGAFDPKLVKQWMPVDQYIGGIEHAVGHLMYSRFITKFLKDQGYLDFDEPFMKLLNQGMVNKDGVKMSKSKGNIVDPIDVIKVHGSDALRTYLLFMAQASKDVEWSDTEMFGIAKFLEKTYLMSDTVKKSKGDKYIDSVAQTKINSVTAHLENLEQNSAIIDMIDFANKLQKHPSIYAYKILLKLLAPFAPCIAEECWEKIGEKKMLVEETWPVFDKEKFSPKEEAAEEYVSTVINDINEIIKLSEMKPEKITIFVSPSWKYQIYNMVVEGKELKDVMKDEKMRKYGNNAVGYFNKLFKKKPLNDMILTASTEMDGLQEKQKDMEATFNCKIDILSAETIDAPKAKVAEPGKPGILIE